MEPLLKGTGRTSTAKVSPAKVALGLLGFGLMACVYTNQGPSSLAMHFQKPVELTALPIEWVEARAGSWNGGADAVIQRLKDAGVARGQIISIDAHNNGPNDDAIFSAHFCKSYPSQGALDLTYTSQNTADYGWATFYSNANNDASGDMADLVSITSSTNENGRAVTYVFKYAPHAVNEVSHASLSTLEQRAGSWNGAADGLISQIKASGAQRGQIVSIDAHNNGPDEDAIFSATINHKALGFGPINDITYEDQNTDAYGWATFYDTAAGQVTPDTISITGSCNTGGRAVLYVFRYQ